VQGPERRRAKSDAIGLLNLGAAGVEDEVEMQTGVRVMHGSSVVVNVDGRRVRSDDGDAVRSIPRTSLSSTTEDNRICLTRSASYNHCSCQQKPFVLLRQGRLITAWNAYILV